MSARRAGAALLLAAVACARQAPAPSPPPPESPSAAQAPYAHVMLLCVDGLRPEPLAEARARGLAAFVRLLEGAHTLNARTDPEWTITLPNHVGMVTGRVVEGPHGHHWRYNDVPPPGLRLRTEVASAFDVVAAAGGRCALFASKEKFVLMPRSWNGVDAGSARGPLHAYAWLPEGADAVRAALDFWRESEGAERTFVMVHLRECDRAGHDFGWDLAPDSAYAHAVATVDRALAEVLAWLEARPERARRTALVLTTDHGGGTPFKNHHGEGHAATNFTIPFLVWGGDGVPRGDLYALAGAARTAPGAAEPGARGPAPVRNLDAANLVTALLGLGPVPGSTVNAAQDLRWRPREEP